MKGKARKVIDNTGVVYRSAREACQKLGLRPCTVSRHLQSERGLYVGFGKRQGIILRPVQNA